MYIIIKLKFVQPNDESQFFNRLYIDTSRVFISGRAKFIIMLKTIESL